MTVLHLGVVDIPYADGDRTTGDVAEILEDKYGIMQDFVDTLGVDAIGNALARSAQLALEAVMMGSNSAAFSLTTEGEQEIEAAFHAFIGQQDMDYRVKGVPTKASLKGVSHRLKHPYAKGNPARASFRDTGTYLNSFKCWVDD
jgi:hypothetical protein